jgi:hypothetical protein
LPADVAGDRSKLTCVAWAAALAAIASVNTDKLGRFILFPLIKIRFWVQGFFIRACACLIK